jgi:hypothetical protein
MIKKVKNPRRDTNQWAKQIVDLATGGAVAEERPKAPKKSRKPSK